MHLRIFILLISASCSVFAQNTKTPVLQVPAAGDAKAAPEEKPAEPKTTENKAPNRAEAYYHYSLAHIYEELVSTFARSEYADKAVEEYKLAIANDPESSYLNAGLAELYAKTGRIRDAVLEAQNILKRDPKNLDAHRLLGRIYLRAIGDTQAGTQSQDVLKLAVDQYEQIVILDPTSVDDHLVLGRLYRLNNDLSKAESEFKTAVKLQPESEEALSSLAYLYTEEGDPGKGAHLLEDVPDSGRSSRLYAALGYTYEQAHDYKKAIDAYKHSVELDRENLDSVRGLAQNLLNDGQTDAALEQYKAIADADPQDAQAQLRIAEILRTTGKFDQALEHLRKAQSLMEDSLEVPYNIARVYEAQGRYDEAIQIVQQLLKKTARTDNNYTAGERNNRMVFLERLGELYREEQKNALALDAFRQMLPLGDDAAEHGYEQIVDTYRSDKQWPQALNAAQEAAQKYPKNRQLTLIYAQQLADNGKAEEGVTSVKALLKNSPDDREVYLALAQMHTRLRQFKEAEDDIAQAEKLSSKPEEKDYVAFVAGSVFEREKKYDEAEDSFKRVLNGDPHNAAVLNYLGYMLADRGLRLEEALGYVKKAIEQDPQNGAYLDSLGWAYFKLGNYELAEENLLKASQKMSNDGTIQDHLAELFFKTGRVKLAAAHWERALEEWNKSVPAEVDSIDVARVQKRLESARIKLAQQQAAAAASNK
jgi:tetratricopeptide (TPR) repeat protein